MQDIAHTLYALAVGLAVLASADSAAAQARTPHHAAHAAQQTSPAKLVTLPLPQQQAPVHADTTITIRTVGSDLEFLPSEIAVKQGTGVRIRYVNDGTFPHNIVLVKAEKDIDALGVAAFDASATDYIPIAMTDRMIAHSTLAAPGQTIEFTFVVPAPGEYPFVCLYPGHYNMMVGTLRSLP